MKDATDDSTCHQEVQILFKAAKCGFGPYEVVQSPSLRILAGRATRYGRRKLDSNQQGLNENDFITDLNHLPPTLLGIVSEKEYLRKMLQLDLVLQTHKGPTVPFVIFFAFLVTGLVLDAIWEWMAFFSIIIPVVAFFVSYSVVKSNFKADVERVFKSWSTVKATFSTNILRGNVALLTLRVVEGAPAGDSGVGEFKKSIFH